MSNNLQQFYQTSSDTKRGLVDANANRAYALNFPAGVKQYKFTADMVNLFDIIPFRIRSSRHPLVVAGKIKPDGSESDDILLYYEHKNVNKNGDSCICNLQTYGEPCPICEERWKQYEKYNRDWKSVDQKLSTKPRVIMNVMDWRDRESGIKVMTGSDFGLRQAILAGAKVNRADAYSTNNAFLKSSETFQMSVLDKATKSDIMYEYLYFASPTKGLGIEMTCINDVYKDHPFVKPTSMKLRTRDVQYSVDVLDNSYELSDFLVQRTYEEVEELLYGAKRETDEVMQVPVSSLAPPVAPVADSPIVVNTPPVVASTPVQNVVTAPPIVVQPTSVIPATQQPYVNVDPQKTGFVPPVCPYAHTVGEDWESTAECSKCIDENIKNYRDCSKLSRAIGNM